MQKAEEAAAEVQEVADPSMLSQDMLRKYITFAKQNCHPKLANADHEKIKEAGCNLCSLTHACLGFVEQAHMPAKPSCMQAKSYSMQN